MKKEIKISFFMPFNAQNTEEQTWGCRANNTDIFAYNSIKYNELKG